MQANGFLQMLHREDVPGDWCLLAASQETVCRLVALAHVTTVSSPLFTRAATQAVCQ